MAALDASAPFDANAIAKAQDETLAEAERLNVRPAPEKTHVWMAMMPQRNNMSVKNQTGLARAEAGPG